MIQRRALFRRFTSLPFPPPPQSGSTGQNRIESEPARIVQTVFRSQRCEAKAEVHSTIIGPALWPNQIDVFVLWVSKFECSSTTTKASALKCETCRGADPLPGTRRIIGYRWYRE